MSTTLLRYVELFILYLCPCFDHFLQTNEEPEEVPMLPSRPRKRKSETTEKTGIVKKSSSRSVSPRRAISDRSSVLTTSSTESGATQTGHYADAYVEVPKLYSTSRNKYKPMGTWDPDRAEIAKTAANKKSQSIVEVCPFSYIKLTADGWTK